MSTYLDAIETNVRALTLVGFSDDYGRDEAREALAIADAIALYGGGGGGGTPPADIASGIDMSVDIDSIVSLLTTIDSDTGDILTSVGDATSVAGDDDVIGQLKAIVAGLAGLDATTFTEFSGTATGVTAVAKAANASALELTIQNKSESEFLYVRLASGATTALSITLLPLQIISWTGFLATLSLNVITNGGPTVDYYGYEVS